MVWVRLDEIPVRHRYVLVANRMGRLLADSHIIDFELCAGLSLGLISAGAPPCTAPVPGTGNELIREVDWGAGRKTGAYVLYRRHDQSPDAGPHAQRRHPGEMAGK